MGKIKAKWRGWSRRRRILVATTALVAVLGGIAAAAILLRAPITGTTQVQQLTVAWSGSPSVVAKDGVITCTPQVSNGSLQVDITGALAGSSCDIQQGVIANGSAVRTVVQDVRYSDKIDTAFVMGCGSPLPDGGTVQVKIRFTVPSGTPAGTYQAASDAGLVAVPETDYVASNCPAVT